MQTSYSLTMAAGLVGALANSNNNHIVSRVGTLAIPFGVFVCRDGADDKVKVPAATADITGANGISGGVVVASQNIESSSSGDPTYPAKSVLPVLKKGQVYVKVEEAVSQGDQAFVRHASGAGTQLGAFRKSADVVATVATATALANAYYESSASAGGLAILSLNMA